jgi:hypothetical protein
MKKALEKKKSKLHCLNPYQVYVKVLLVKVPTHTSTMNVVNDSTSVRVDANPNALHLYAILVRKHQQRFIRVA